MNRRLVVVQFFFVLAVTLIVYKCIQVQLFPDQRLVKNQETLYKAQVLRVASRGSIFDRNGSPLAVSVTRYSLFAHPKQILHPDHAAKLLAPILDTSKERLSKLLTSKKSFVWLKRKVSLAKKKQIQKLPLQGVFFLNEPARFYPNKDLASHVLGYTDIDLKGVSGVEVKYAKALEGIHRTVRLLKDARGRMIYVGKDAASSSKPGYNLYLTLDQQVQYLVEEELKRLVDRFSAKGAMAIALDPMSGEVLALSVVPNFDPNQPGAKAVQYGRNRIIMDVMEPGSTLKTLTIAAAIQHRVAQPNKIYNCLNGRIRIGKHVITDADMDHVYPRLAFSDILKYSSNVCTIQVARDLGSEKLHKFLKTMGFGELTGIDLPFETKGVVPDVSGWRPIHLATISYGHGISVTPMQLVVAYAAFANGGFKVTPHVLKKVEDDQGRLIYDNTQHKKKRLISSRVSNQVMKYLRKVTEGEGTGIAAAPFGFPIPGKTGTAVKYVEAYGGYKSGAYLSSFIGMFPSKRPEVILFILVDEPQKRMYGGDVAGPAFRAISELIIGLKSMYTKIMPASKKLSIPLSRRKSGVARLIQKAFKSRRMPNLHGLTLSQVRDLTKKHQLDFIYYGAGKVTGQFPKPGVRMMPNTAIKVVLKPDFD